MVLIPSSTLEIDETGFNTPLVSPTGSENFGYQIEQTDDDLTPTPTRKFLITPIPKPLVKPFTNTDYVCTVKPHREIVINNEIWDAQKVERLIKQKQENPKTKLKLKPYNSPLSKFDPFFRVKEQDHDLVGATPLYAACAYGNLELLTSLLSLQTQYPDEDIGLLGLNNETKHIPFSIACKNEQVEVIKTLLDFHIKYPNIQMGLGFLNQTNHSLLYYACINIKLKTLTVLLDFISKHPESSHIYGSNQQVLPYLGLYDQTPSHISFPLYVACREGYTEVVKSLLNFKIRNPKIHVGASQPHLIQKYTPFQLVCKQRNIDIIQLFLELKIQCSNTPFHIAKEHQATGNSPIFEACLNGDVNVVEALVLFKIAHPQEDIGTCYPHDKKGTTPLFEACSIGNAKIVRLFLRLKDSIPEEDIGLLHTHPTTGNTPFFEACVKGHLSVLEAFLEFIPHHPKIETGLGLLNPKTRNPPFHQVFINKQTNLVERFLKFKREHPNIIIALRFKHEVTGNTVLHIACKSGDTKQLDFLLQTKKLKPELHIGERYLDAEKMTPVHAACIHGEDEIVAKLVEYQSREYHLDFGFVYQHPDTGETPLHAAILAGKPEVVMALTSNRRLDIGIDIPHPESQKCPSQLAKDNEEEELAEHLEKLERQFEKDLEFIDFTIDSLKNTSQSSSI